MTTKLKHGDYVECDYDACDCADKPSNAAAYISQSTFKNLYRNLCNKYGGGIKLQIDTKTNLCRIGFTLLKVGNPNIKNWCEGDLNCSSNLTHTDLSYSNIFVVDDKDPRAAVETEYMNPNELKTKQTA